MYPTKFRVGVGEWWTLRVSFNQLWRHGAERTDILSLLTLRTECLNDTLNISNYGDFTNVLGCGHCPPRDPFIDDSNNFQVKEGILYTVSKGIV